MSNDSFVWSLQLSGAKSNPLTLNFITIPARSSFIVGDNLAMFSLFNGFQIRSWLSLNFVDTNAVNLSLWWWASLLDTFIVDTWSVLSIDNTKTSFHKQFSSLGVPTILPSLSNLSLWLLPGYVGHPGRVYTDQWWLLIPQPSSLTWWSSTGSTTIDCSTVNSGIVVIDELHFWSQYASYIELLFLTDRIGGLQLSGTALGQAITLPSQPLKANTCYFFSHSNSNFHHTDHIIIVPSLSLLTGLLQVSSDTMFPLWYLLVDTNRQSVYHTTLYNCLDDFATEASPSPWFDEQFLPYLNTQTLTQTVTGSCVTSTGNSTTTWPTTYQYSTWWWQFHDVRISLIDYDPPGTDTNNERIGLQSFTGVDINLSGWYLSYDGRLFSFTSGFLSSGQELIITGNYVFVNSRPVCISLYYWQIQIDVACYDPSQNTSPFSPLWWSTGNVIISSGWINDQLDYSALQFDITHLVYDPPWSDTNTESVTIHFISGADSIVLDNFRLRVGTSNRRIYGTLLSGQTSPFFGSFMMSNSNPTCVALTYNDIVYDEYCYNPSSSTISPSSSQPSTISSNFYLHHLLSLTNVVYDPPWSDTNNESVTILMTGDQSPVDLTKLYLRIGNYKKYLSWQLLWSGMVTITGNFQMSNSKATCIDLMEWDHLFDTYCYDPNNTTSPAFTGSILTDEMLSALSWITIVDIIYNPEWSDTDRESLTIDSGSGFVYLSGKVYLRFHDTTKILFQDILLHGRQVFTGNYSLPNTKDTCVELVYNNTTLDSYCYTIDDVQDTTQFDWIQYYSWLQLDWVLPNPTGKDIKHKNEQFALSWSTQNRQKLTKHVKVMIGKSTINLSGYQFRDSILTIASPKALTNQAACLRLVVDNKEIDRICYPQTKEWLLYYHERFGRKTTLPSSLIQSLDRQWVDLSDLRLVKSGKKICLRYNTIDIRCMSAWSSSSSLTTRRLTTLANAYITQMSDLIATRQLQYSTLNTWTESYRALAKMIRNHQSMISLYGYDISTTDLEKYHHIVYERSSDDKLVDLLGHIAFGEDIMNQWYSTQ